MRTSANFDSVGLSTGKDIREIYETVDTLMTANVMRRLSKNTHLLADKWYEYAILQIDKADKENLIILRKALTEAKSIIVNDITQSAEVGVKEIDRQAKSLKLDLRPKPEERLTQVDIAYRALAGASNVALTSATTEMLGIISLARLLCTRTPELPLKTAIDMASGRYIEKGNTGKISVNGGQLGLSGYSSLVMREASTEAYREAQGGRRREYGLTLVQISKHASSCDLCLPWEHKVLEDDRYGGSLGQSKYPLLSRAIDAGLFHFNCRHGMQVYVHGVTKPPPVPKDTPETVRKQRVTYNIEQRQRALQAQARRLKKRALVAVDEQTKERALEMLAKREAGLEMLADEAKRQGVPFYRQDWKEQVTFKFKTFKPELAKLKQ